MDYIEFTCKLSGNIESTRDIIIAELSDLGFESFMEKDDGINAYINSDLFDYNKIKDLYLFKNPSFGIKEVSHTLYKSKNWNEYWEKNFKPVNIENKLLIRAPFHQSIEGIKNEIIIEPKMSFGTGHHETTYLMLQEMLNISFEEKRVLDIGCGTGILSIFASKKGAEKVIAVDNNEWAFNNAVENININNAKNIQTLHGDIKDVGSGHFDFILANINRNVILNEFKEYVKYILNDGEILISGILKDDFDLIQAEAKYYRMKFLYLKERNNWIMARFKKVN